MRPAFEKPVHVYGVGGCSIAYAIRDFLQRSDVPFEWKELTSETFGELRYEQLPLLEFPDGTRLERPTLRQITEKLGWFLNPSQTEYDLAIFGAGPAGLSAAVYGASEGLKTVVIERSAIGGQAGTSSRIENYLGFPDGISGADLALRARDQAVRFGAEILLLREGMRAEFQPGRGIGYLTDGTKIVTHATICATGVVYCKLNLPNEDRFSGQGVYYGAGSSEAALCAGQHVFVVGGGNSAGQAALHFAKRCTKVTMVVRGAALKDTLSTYLVDRIYASPEIEVLTRTEVTALHGDRVLSAITLTNRDTGAQQTIDTAWLFLCLGGTPHTEWSVEHGIIRDKDGYLVTGPDLLQHGWGREQRPISREPYYLETSMPGLFAAGDVRHGSVKRCASAVGEGAMAVSFVHRYLAIL